MKTSSKILKQNDVLVIQKLLSEGASSQTIALATGVSETTVKRIKNGTHYLLRQKETATAVDKEEMIKIYGDKLLEIIDLLKELTDMTKKEVNHNENKK